MNKTLASRRRALLAVLALCSAACSSSTGTGGSVVLEIDALAAPDTVAVGATLTVVATVVTGGCVSFSKLEASRSATRLTLVARGVDHGGPAISCPADIRHEPHAYTLTMTRAGTFVVSAYRTNGNNVTRNVQVQ